MWNDLLQLGFVQLVKVGRRNDNTACKEVLRDAAEGSRLVSIVEDLRVEARQSTQCARGQSSNIDAAHRGRALHDCIQEYQDTGHDYATEGWKVESGR